MTRPRLRQVLDALLDDQLLDYDGWATLTDDLDRLEQTSRGGPAGVACPQCGALLVLHRPTRRLIPAPTTTTTTIEEDEPACSTD